MTDEDRRAEHAEPDTGSIQSAPAAKTSEKVPWYGRGKALMLSAGAIAAAALAVLGLWDRIFPVDQGDIAKIESVSLMGQTSFKEFAHERFGVDLELEPMRESSSSGVASVVAQVSTAEPVAPVDPPVVTPVEPTVPDSFVVPDPMIPLESPAPTEPVIPPTPPAPIPIPPTLAPFTQEPEEIDPDSPPSELVAPREWSVPEDFVQAVSSQEPLLKWEFDEAELQTSLFMLIDPSGESGEELAPEEAAARVAEALSVVATSTDEAGALDPSGWTVAVNLTVEGLEDVPLLLTWSLDGVDVPDEWAAEKVTYRVVAGTPHDTGSAEIWVPRLTTPGQYNVNVKLRLASDAETIIASGQPLTIAVAE